MGKQKGDKGLVPVLESMVGLPLPSAMHIARYLSSHTPPNLLHKVLYSSFSFSFFSCLLTYLIRFDDLLLPGKVNDDLAFAYRSSI